MNVLSLSAQKLVLGAISLFVISVSFSLFGTQTAVISSLLGCAMLAIAHEDAKRFIVPDLISLPAIPAGLLAAKYLSEQEAGDQLLMYHLMAAVLSAAMLWTVRYLFKLWRNIEGLGMGDVKLAAVAGAWTGLSGIGPVLLLACTGAIVYVACIALTGHAKVTGRTAIPFGCFLAPSIWLVWSFSRL